MFVPLRKYFNTFCLVLYPPSSMPYAFELSLTTHFPLLIRLGNCLLYTLIIHGYTLMAYLKLIQAFPSFIGLAYQEKDIVFRFIIEYSSLRNFGPYIVIGPFLYEEFWKMIFWLVLKLEILVIELWYLEGFLVSFRGFFWRWYFYMVKYLNFHTSSFALRYLFNVKGKATMWHTPMFQMNEQEAL
jgi:hypothetical protein